MYALTLVVDTELGVVLVELSAEDQGRLESAVAKVTFADEVKVRQRFAAAFSAAAKKGADSRLLDGVKSLWAMLTDPDYVVTWQTKTQIVFALGYFISPVDAVPDLTPGIGFVDDLLVVLWALHNLEEEVAAYRKLRGIATA